MTVTLLSIVIPEKRNLYDEVSLTIRPLRMNRNNTKEKSTKHVQNNCRSNKALITATCVLYLPEVRNKRQHIP